MTWSHNPIEKAGDFQVYPPFANDPLFVFESAFRAMSGVDWLMGERGPVVFTVEFDNGLRMLVQQGKNRTYLHPADGSLSGRNDPKPTDYFFALADLFNRAQVNGRGSELLDGLKALTRCLGDLNE